MRYVCTLLGLSILILFSACVGNTNFYGTNVGNGGTTVGNSVRVFSNAWSSSSIKRLRFCAKKVHLTNVATGEVEQHDVEWGMSVMPHKGFVGNLSLPTGNYRDLVLECSSDCDGSSESEGAVSLEVIRSRKDRIETAETVPLRFRGAFHKVFDVPVSLHLDLQPLVDALGPLQMGSDIPPLLLGANPPTGNTQTNQPATYAVWNGLDGHSMLGFENGYITTFLDPVITLNQFRSIRATRGRSAGKWYWEVSVDELHPSWDTIAVGFIGREPELGSSIYALSMEGMDCGYTKLGSFSSMTCNAIRENAGTAPSFEAPSVIGFALDLDTRQASVHVNGIWVDTKYGTKFFPIPNNTTPEIYPAVSLYVGGDKVTGRFDPAQMTYDPPEGFLKGW